MKLVKNYKTAPEQFDSSILEVGQMMVITEKPYNGHIILRIFDGIVSLTNPKYTWDIDTPIIGRLLKPGESVTLIQE